MYRIGLVRTAAAVPKIKVANTDYNTEQILSCIDDAAQNGAGIILFPELCITGYTCADLFYQEFLYKRQLENLKRIAEETRKYQVRNHQRRQTGGEGENCPRHR